MILVDANLLLYAYDSSSTHHERARRWLEAALSGPEPIGLPWPSILAFIRLATSREVFRRPLAPRQAVEIVDEWLAVPTAAVVTPGERHWEILRELLPASQSRGPLVMDAHLAALALERGAVLCTTDRDFARFEDLKWVNPLGERERRRGG